VALRTADLAVEGNACEAATGGCTRDGAAQPLSLADIRQTATHRSGWQVPDSLVHAGETALAAASHFPVVWTRKDPPVDEVYLNAIAAAGKLGRTAGVRVLTGRGLLALEEKLGFAAFSELMAPAPSLVQSAQRWSGALASPRHQDVVLNRWVGRVSQGVVRCAAAAPGLRLCWSWSPQQDAAGDGAGLCGGDRGDQAHSVW